MGIHIIFLLLFLHENIRCGNSLEASRRGVSARRFSLRKHAYSNILRILPTKNEHFQMKNSDIFLISAQNIDCRYSLEGEAVLTSIYILCFEQK